MKRNRCSSRQQPVAKKRRGRRQRGAAIVLIVLLLAAFVATAALSVDIAYMNLVNGQLRASTDAAAMAAVEVLGQTQDTGAALAAAKHIASTNQVSGQGLTLIDEDVVFGHSRYQAGGAIAFTPNQLPYNAARVTGRKEQSSPSGASPLFFAGIFGMSEWDTRQIATAARWERDICLVVDRSFSMSFDNKMPDLRDAVSIFLDVLENDAYEDKIALASYNQVPQLNQNLTYDLNLIRMHMSLLTPNGQTNIGGGIITGQSVLMGLYARPHTEKTMILLTDGIHNIGYDPITAAKQVAANGIVIHTISFGPDADQQRMQEVADISGGTAYHAPDGKTLKEIFRRIALTFGTVLTE